MHADQSVTEKLTAHTPGPWKVGQRAGQGKGGIAIAAEGSVFCLADIISGPLGHTDETCANARLIAAAPELLTALRSARHALYAVRYDMGSTAATGTQEALGDQIDAAIAKAEGQVR